LIVERRAGLSHIAPDFVERQKFPLLWYQSGHVVNGAASYTFGMLATRRVRGR